MTLDVFVVFFFFFGSAATRCAVGRTPSSLLTKPSEYPRFFGVSIPGTLDNCCAGPHCLPACKKGQDLGLAPVPRTVKFSMRSDPTQPLKHLLWKSRTNLYQEALGNTRSPSAVSVSGFLCIPATWDKKGQSCCHC